MNNIQVNLDENGVLVTVPSHNTTLIEKYHDIGTSLFKKILGVVDKKIHVLLQDLYAGNNGYKITDKNFVLLVIAMIFGSVT